MILDRLLGPEFLSDLKFVLTRLQKNTRLFGVCAAERVGSGAQLDLVVIELNHRGATQNVEQHGHAFAGDALDQAFDAAQGRVFEAHGLARLEVAEFLQRGVVAVLLDLTNALHEFVVEHGRLETETDDVGDAFGAAHHRDALLGLAGTKQDIPRKHGFKMRHGTLFGFLEFFIERQIGLKSLLRQIGQGHLLLPRLGVGQIPTFRRESF